MRLRTLVVVLGAALFVALGVHNAGATADPLWSRQYGPVQIGAPTAWQKSTGKGVKVAIVDSGVDIDHPDLKANLTAPSDWYDFACDDADPDDDAADRGHGTHVGGTVGAVTNNNLGVAGVAPDVKLMPVKVFPTDDTCGPLATALIGSVPPAINWAVDHGAKVINLSLDAAIAFNIADAVEEPCNQAFVRGSLCVVAAGNSGETKSSGYAYDFNGIVVTANDSTGAHATFGQKADTKWSVSAPGVDVLSTWPIDDPKHNGYNSIQGTSMAAPHVAGAAAVLFAAGMNLRQVVEALVNTAGPPRGDSNVEGAGIIHMDKALGLQSPDAPGAATNSGAAEGTVRRSGSREAAAGGARPTVPTTTTIPGRTPVSGGVAFEEGLLDGGDEIEAVRLREASKNSANKPFNVTGPLIGLSILSSVALVAVAVPRLRSKDNPPLV